MGTSGTLTGRSLRSADHPSSEGHRYPWGGIVRLTPEPGGAGGRHRQPQVSRPGATVIRAAPIGYSDSPSERWGGSTSGSRPRDRSGRAQPEDGSVRPLDPPRPHGGRHALEPRRPQRDRRRHSPAARLNKARPGHDLVGPSSSTPSSPFVTDNRYLAPWIFVATDGCRRGECLGLRWADVDLDGATAVISRQVTSIDHVIVVKELPKTRRGHMGGPRLEHGHAPAAAGAAERGAPPRRLRLHRRRLRVLQARRHRVRPGPLQPGFPPQAGAVQQSRRNRPAAEADPPRPAPYVGNPCLALHEGIDIKVVSDRLNHSSTFVTREIYTHVTPPTQSDGAERVAKWIFRSR